MEWFCKYNQIELTNQNREHMFTPGNVLICFGDYLISS